MNVWKLQIQGLRPGAYWYHRPQAVGATLWFGDPGLVELPSDRRQGSAKLCRLERQKPELSATKGVQTKVDLADHLKLELAASVASSTLAMQSAWLLIGTKWLGLWSYPKGSIHMKAVRLILLSLAGGFS